MQCRSNNKMAKSRCCNGGLLATLALLAIVSVPCSSLSVGRSSSSFVGRRGAQFVLDGSPFLFNGFNAYWMMHVAAEPAERPKVSEVLRAAANTGLTVGRAWAFSDGGDRALQLSPGVYDERVFQGLDFVIAEAQKNGLRLILSLANNYKDFGGRAQYVQWAREAGVAVTGDDDFYTNSVVKRYYKNHVQKVLTRVNEFTNVAYKDDPTILAWELINEPRCQEDYSGKTVDAWVREMASYCKSLDRRHMVEIGMEGFYGDSMPEKKQYNPGYQVGTDYISSNLIEEIDFSTIHAYPDLWLPGQNEEAQTRFVQRWLQSHWDDTAKTLKKPLVFTEFGKSKKDPGYSEQARDVYLDAVFAGIYDLARIGDGSLGGGLVWQLMAQGMESYYDGYEIVLAQDAATSAVLARQSRLMSVLARTMNVAVADQEADGDEKEGRLAPRGRGRKHGGHLVKQQREGSENGRD